MSTRFEAAARTLWPGQAEGEALVLQEPLSFWGGVDPATGAVIDRRHPQAGANVRATVLVMPSGRGSSSSSTVLVESLRAGTAPAAVVLREPDPIIVLAAVVAEELYGLRLPVVLLDEASPALRTGDVVEVAAGPEGAMVRVRRAGD